MRTLIIALLALGLWATHAVAETRADWALPDFSLTEKNGAPITLNDLKGSYWVANFIFTRCQGPCPLLSNRMAVLQKELPKDMRLVSFTVDPGYDSPKVLTQYAAHYNADPARWLFVTGGKTELYTLIRQGFKVGVDENPGADPGEGFIHTTLFALIGPEGKLRALYHGDDWEDLKKIVPDARRIALRERHPVIARFPMLNAGLNATAFIFLMLGYRFIKRKRTEAHRVCMVAAFAVSVLFLVFYLIYHAYAGSVPFQGQGWLRTVYFTILLSHTVLAAIVPFLALRVLYLAWRGDFARHKALARWTLPLWAYVSVTGVTIYIMLYTRP